MLFSLSNSFPVSLLLLVIAGALQMVYLTTNMTIVQLTVPDELRGRVMGVYMLNQGLLPLGSVLAGVLASIWSAPTAVCAMGAVVMLLALVFGSQPSRLRSM